VEGETIAFFGEGTFSALGDDFIGGPGNDYVAEAVGSERLGDVARYNKLDYTHASGPIALRSLGGGMFTVTGDGTDTIDASQIGTLYGSPYDDLIEGEFAMLYARGGTTPSSSSSGSSRTPSGPEGATTRLSEMPVPKLWSTAVRETTP
jgi:hypothetical protein